MDSNQKSLKKLIYLGGGAFILIIVVSFLWFIMFRAGLKPVNVIVIPTDSTVTYSDGSIRDGLNYMRTGKHSVTIARPGFLTKTFDITVDDDTSVVGITTSAENDDGRKYLEDNPREDVKYENLGAQLNIQRGEVLTNLYPNLSKLPQRHYSMTSVYTISYGGADPDKRPIIVITNSSTNGRKDAIQWLKDNEFDINQLNIIFDDYDSPLITKGNPADVN